MRRMVSKNLTVASGLIPDLSLLATNLCLHQHRVEQVDQGGVTRRDTVSIPSVLGRVKNRQHLTVKLTQIEPIAIQLRQLLLDPVIRLGQRQRRVLALTCLPTLAHRNLQVVRLNVIKRLVSFIQILFQWGVTLQPIVGKIPATVDIGVRRLVVLRMLEQVSHTLDWSAALFFKTGTVSRVVIGVLVLVVSVAILKTDRTNSEHRLDDRVD